MVGVATANEPSLCSQEFEEGVVMSSITYEHAQNVLQAALRKANETGVPSSVAIVDEGRELIAFARQTGALLASIEISIAKSYTACSLHMSTVDVRALPHPARSL